MTTAVQLLLEVKQRTTGLNQGVAAVERAGKQMQASASKTSLAMNKMGMSIKSALGGFLGVSAIVGFFRSTEAATRKFSAAIADLSAITGATGKDLEYLKNASQELGSTTLSSASEVAEAFKLVGSVKADLLNNLPALRQTTEQVLLLATASGVDLATAAKVTGSALNQYGVGADQAARFVNVLAAGSKYGAAEVNDLGESLKFVGPVAGQLGVSFESTISALEGLAEAGIKGSEAGTGLRAVLIRLATQSNTQFNPAIVGLEQALKNLRDANISVEQANDLFGRTAVSSGLALIQFANKADQMTKSVTGTGTALEQAAIQADSYAAKVKKLGNALESLQIVVGEKAAGRAGIFDVWIEQLDSLKSGIKEYGLLLGTVKGLTLDTVALPGKLLGRKLFPTGDAGIAKPISFESIKGFKRSELPKAPNLALQGLGELLTSSFITPIGKAGGELKYFAESLQEANQRLSNSFQDTANVYKNAASNLINDVNKENVSKLGIDEAKASLKDSNFMKLIQEGTEIARDLKFAKGDEKNILLQKLDNINNQIDSEAYKNQKYGNYAVPTAMGGTFSVVGNNQSSITEQRIKKSLADQFNNFITQQLNQVQRIEVTVNVKPDDESLIKFVGKATDKKLKDAAIDAAMS